MTARTEALKRKAVEDIQGASKRGKSVRDAWFDEFEKDGLGESIYDEVLAKLQSVMGEDKVKEASSKSYSHFAHLLCDELCPGVVKVLEDDESEEDPDEDAIDDEDVEEELSETEEEDDGVSLDDEDDDDDDENEEEEEEEDEE